MNTNDGQWALPGNAGPGGPVPGVPVPGVPLAWPGAGGPGAGGPGVSPVPGYHSQPTPPGAVPGYPSQPMASGPAPVGGAANQPSAQRYYAYNAVQPGIIPLRPLTFSDIYNGIFRLIRFNPKVAVGFTMLLSAATAVVHGLLELYVRNAFSVQLHKLFGSTADGVMGKDLTVTLLVSPFTIGVVSIILTGMIVIAASRAAIGDKISPAETWKMVLPRVPALIGVSLLTSLTTALPMLLAVAGIFGLIGERMSGSEILFAVVMGLIFGALAVIASLYLTIKLMFGSAAVTLEKMNPLAALKRSWGLTKGVFWRLTGHYVLIYVIVQTLASVLLTPIMVVMMLTATTTGGDTVMLPLWFTPLTAGITTVITVLFMSTLFTLLYTDVRMRREGLDISLMRAASEFAAQNAK